MPYAFLLITLKLLAPFSTIPITFDFFANGDQIIDGEMEVEIRGFLFQAHDGVWILASDPQLKSCCIGAASLAKHQLYLDRQFSINDAGRPIKLHGKLRRSLQYSPDGKIKTLYKLLQTEPVDQAPLSFPWVTLSAVSLLAAVFSWRMIKASRWRALKRRFQGDNLR